MCEDLQVESSENITLTSGMLDSSESIVIGRTDKLEVIGTGGQVNGSALSLTDQNQFSAAFDQDSSFSELKLGDKLCL